MKKLLLLAGLLSSQAFAELPPPGTSRKGPITVTPQGRSTYTYDLEKQAVINRADRKKVQKKLDALRAENARLKEENELLRNRPVAVANIPVSTAVANARAAMQPEPKRAKKNRISGLAGWGPQSLTNRRKDASRGNKIEVENGPVVGGLYQRLLGETVSIGAGATVPTYADEKKPTYVGTVGIDF